MPDLAETSAAWSGFSFRLPDVVLHGAATVGVRLANTGERLGTPLALAEPRPAAATAAMAHVAWAGGLRLGGCLDKPALAGATVKALVDGEVVAEVTARGWTTGDAAHQDLAFPSFDIHLPPRFADGRVRHVDVAGPDGDWLPGSPCFVVAFADGLEAFIDSRTDLASERIRARFAQGLLPQSWPLSGFTDYLARFAPPASATELTQSVAVVLIGEEGLEASLSSLDLGGSPGIMAACLPRNGSGSEFLPDDLTALLEGDAREVGFVVFTRSGATLRAGALPALAEAFQLTPDAPFVYGDYAVRDDGRLWPMVLPGFDLERWMEQGYAATIFAMRLDRALAGARRGASSLFHLINETLVFPPSSVQPPVHIPLILAELQAKEPGDDPALESATRALLERIGGAATLTPRAAATAPAVRVRRLDQRTVSIVVPTRTPSERLGLTLDALRSEIERATVEVIVVDDGAWPAADPSIWALFERGGGTRVILPGSFQASRARNAGAAVARGDYLFFIDDGTVPAESWQAVLDELIGRMAGPSVGAVGPVVVWPSGLIRSAGLLLGPGLAAAPAFADRLVGDPGYAGLLEVAHEVSALPADAMMTPRDLFNAQGGFDSRRFWLSQSEVDYSLGLRAQDLRIVVTPDVRMIVTDPDAAKPPVTEPHELRLAREKVSLQSKWGEAIMADAFYSPWLALDGPAYSALAWPPRERVARTNRIGRPRTFPPACD